MTPEQRVAQLVLSVHRRNGGSLGSLDPGWRLLEPELRLDSLDLAEIMAAIEQEFGVSPFDRPVPPRTWGELITGIAPGSPAPPREGGATRRSGG